MIIQRFLMNAANERADHSMDEQANEQVAAMSESRASEQASRPTSGHFGTTSKQGHSNRTSAPVNVDKSDDKKNSKTKNPTPTSGHLRRNQNDHKSTKTKS